METFSPAIEEGALPYSLKRFFPFLTVSLRTTPFESMWTGSGALSLQKRSGFCGYPCNAGEVSDV